MNRAKLNPLDPRFGFRSRGGFDETSSESPKYNCIAWAAGDDSRWWWPDSQNLYFWPQNSPRQETVDAFVAVFASLGFCVCDNSAVEDGYEKIAIFAKGGKATHAARQITTGNQAGRWTSKMGKNIDLVHDLEAASGPAYGEVRVIMRRLGSHTNNDTVST